jgi:hypothetical protein
MRCLDGRTDWGGLGKAPNESEALARQFEFFNRRIDNLVYEMYGLSDAEIALGESNP